ncbi:hypothetical protein vBYenM636_82 [Yersinia phage vB_YenM_636]|nr:hypothetical protein X1_64 [Yersinia phage vB_Yen_X1]QKN86333.1 hypothetical protein vBYenM12_82 [Yersinia phage vB_YenM_12]QKN86424.1 hypothetical protein vBYenM22_82 [Yersinia phage vB_YenM_22]QKN86515.1 hypothetical protein vBYenM25_82 [Yersinia phage vB_YenM_25]QKN86606.1 hypothetical protein vBYenM27_82 [Yersinia phage vB_YenM_27]QKN86697.1 hypothetical protein vBYenM39_82 [Yersinia phage vB_YenM_39]QKN86788.1 hypothetical protein vBYenM126_82 [Yersinia phage vB_YenM_126]QKN86879.1 h
MRLEKPSIATSEEIKFYGEAPTYHHVKTDSIFMRPLERRRLTFNDYTMQDPEGAKLWPNADYWYDKKAGGYWAKYEVMEKYLFWRKTNK